MNDRSPQAELPQPQEIAELRDLRIGQVDNGLSNLEDDLQIQRVDAIDTHRRQQEETARFVLQKAEELQDGNQKTLNTTEAKVENLALATDQETIQPTADAQILDLAEIRARVAKMQHPEQPDIDTRIPA